MLLKQLCDSLILCGCSERIQEAALLHASVENWGECLAALHVGQYRGLAALLLQHIGPTGTPEIIRPAQL